MLLQISLSLIIAGLIGLMGMTFLFPFLLNCFRRAPVRLSQFKTASAATEPGVTEKKVAILIPAYKEREALSATINSIKRAIKHASEGNYPIKVELAVGVDGADRHTCQIVSDELATLHAFTEHGGKWQTLLRLFENYKSYDWVIFADCGICWERELLVNFYKLIGNTSVCAVAPCYDNPSGGWLEKQIWKLENYTKTLETRLGGPVTVHGASIAYKVSALQPVLKLLARKNWLNDDVVIPLLMRTLEPESSIIYAPECRVTDLPEQEAAAQSEFPRRKRMVLGNIEWIKLLMPFVFRNNFLVFFLAMRRVFRVFWSYWLLAFVLGATLFLFAFNTGLGLVTIALGAVLTYALFCCVPFVKKFLAAGLASLAAPYYLYNQSSGARIAWR